MPDVRPPEAMAPAALRPAHAHGLPVPVLGADVSTKVLICPCRKCGGQRDTFGVSRCWACLTPAERKRFKLQRVKP